MYNNNNHCQSAVLQCSFMSKKNIKFICEQVLFDDVVFRGFVRSP